LWASNTAGKNIGVEILSVGDYGGTSNFGERALIYNHWNAHTATGTLIWQSNNLDPK
jgi:hypothetical protein